eukprot:scaffold81376_cov57-Phaeocystis_antarctica.AAC.5
MPIPRTNTSETAYIVVVDPMSTGATLAYHAQHHQGLRIICVWSDACPAELRGHSKHGVEYAGVVIHEAGGIKATCAAIRKIAEPRDVFCGSEPGVELADELSTPACFKRRPPSATTAPRPPACLPSGPGARLTTQQRSLTRPPRRPRRRRAARPSSERLSKASLPLRASLPREQASP